MNSEMGAFHASAAHGLSAVDPDPTPSPSAPPRLSLDAQRWMPPSALLLLVFGRRTRICRNLTSSREKLLRDLFVAVTELVSSCFVLEGNI